MIDWVDGQPFSPRFGDVYFSRSSGIEETRHVFLAGNALAERFGALPPRGLFTVGETGFGTGLNFLCTWQLFAQTAPADARLAYVSTELYPLSPADLRRALALWPALDREAGALLSQYDWMAPGWHRFVFDGGRITLTLLIGDARRTLAALDAVADAWFLDGFAPARNPELWEATLFQEISRHSTHGTTFATYSSAGDVRRGLEAAGFAVEKIPGFGPKREMSRGRCVRPLARPYCAPWLRRPPAIAARTAIVVGGGLAGTSAAASLAQRGFEVALIERHDRLAAEASGNPQGVLYARLSPHATVLSRLLLDGYQFTLRELSRRLPEDGRAWSRCGVLQLAHDAAEEARQEKLAALDWPEAILRRVSGDEASRIAGVPAASGGLWFAGGGWVHPPALCAALARHPRIRTSTATEVLGFERAPDGRWRVLSGDRELGRAAVLVLAQAVDVRRFPATASLPLHAIRGQLTYLPATPASARLRTVLCGESYVAPVRDGRHCVGATFVIRDESTDVRPEEHAANLEMLARLSPGFAQAAAAEQLDPAALDGRAALRCVSPDYLPLVGAIPDAAAFRQRFAALARDATTEFDAPVPWLEGLLVSTAHGSRGLLTAPIAGELLASGITGEPLPVEASVAGGLAPARFLARALVRREA